MIYTIYHYRNLETGHKYCNYCKGDVRAEPIGCEIFQKKLTNDYKSAWAESRRYDKNYRKERENAGAK